MYSENDLKRLFINSRSSINKYKELLDAYIECEADYLDNKDHASIKRFIQSICEKDIEAIYENFFYGLETILRDATIKVLEALNEIDNENYYMFLGESLMN